jgi:DNA anti-recombination protein RmuC
MEPAELTLEILKEIRTEVRSTHQRLDATNQRLDTTNQRVEEVGAGLSKRIEEVGVGLSKRIDETNQRVEEMGAGLSKRIEEVGVGLSKRIDETNHRIEEVGAGLSKRIDATNARVQLLHEGQLRLATEVIGVASAVSDLSALLREDRLLRSRVDDHEKRLTAVERRGG